MAGKKGKHHDFSKGMPEGAEMSVSERVEKMANGFLKHRSASSYDPTAPSGKKHMSAQTTTIHHTNPLLHARVAKMKKQFEELKPAMTAGY